MRSANRKRRVMLGAILHGDQKLWGWVASDRLTILRGRMFDHGYHLLTRMPARSWLTDASEFGHLAVVVQKPGCGGDLI